MTPHLGTIFQNCRDGFLSLGGVEPPEGATVMYVTGGGRFWGYVLQINMGSPRMVVAFDDGSEMVLCDGHDAPFDITIPAAATRMWVSEVQICMFDEMQGDVTAVENLDGWIYYSFYDYGLEVTDYRYGQTVSLVIDGNPNVESILPEPGVTAAPWVYVYTCPVLATCEIAATDDLSIESCPKLNADVGGDFSWEPEGGNYLYLYLVSNDFTQAQVHEVLDLAGMAASAGAFSNGGTLDVTGNAAPDTSDPGITDALDALAARNVDVYHE